MDRKESHGCKSTRPFKVRHRLLASRVNVGEHDECRGLIAPLRNSVVGGLADEAKSALAANHEPLDNLKRVVDREIDQGVERVASGALYGELPADEVCKLAV